MKNYLLIYILIYSFNSYSQSKDTIYFLINRKDSLIKKQIATKTNKYEGYRIIDEKTLVINTKRSSDLGGNDIQYETFDSYSFSFNRKNDTIISNSYLKTLNLIISRKKFINIKKKGYYFDTSGFLYFFIEKTNHKNKYILRKVYPVSFE